MGLLARPDMSGLSRISQPEEGPSRCSRPGASRLLRMRFDVLLDVDDEIDARAHKN